MVVYVWRMVIQGWDCVLDMIVGGMRSLISGQKQWVFDKK